MQTTLLSRKVVVDKQGTLPKDYEDEVGTVVSVFFSPASLCYVGVEYFDGRVLSFVVTSVRFLQPGEESKPKPKLASKPVKKSGIENDEG